MPSFPGKEHVSLCVIARDEAEKLPRLLASALPFVAEAVVVDTGSRDGTVNVARSLGARVVERPWQHSFAIARNGSLELAQTPWALVLDADEELVVSDAAAFAGALTNGLAGAYAVDCHDLRDDGTVAVAPLLRLFRRDLPDMRYEGAVHEQLIAVARGQARVAPAPFLHFRHDGHTAAALHARDKHARNLALARQQLAAKPEDAFTWFCLGQALATAPDPASQQEAADAYATALTRLTGAHAGEAFVVSLFANLAVLQQRLGQPLAAAATLDEGLAHFPHSPDLLFARARTHLADGAAARAEALFRACLEPRATSFFVRLDPATATHRARTHLAMCLIKQGRLMEATPHLEQAAQESPAADTLAATLLGKLRAATQR